jgi:hypothetical protein
MTTDKVTVYVNGKARLVPKRTYSAEETYEALDLPFGVKVAYDYARNCYLDFDKGWGFVNGMHYVVELCDACSGDDNDGPADETDNREPWVQDADWWRR